MQKEIKNLLTNLDKKIPSLDANEIIKEFEKIPLVIFGRIQINRPPEYPNLCNWFAHMPPSELQSIWNGSSDQQLMSQSLTLIKTILNTYNSFSEKSLKDSLFLDFGCGWGRLIRLMNKYIPENQIYGVDPWEKSIALCREKKVRANFYVSDYIPRDLPTPEGLKFDFIMSHSVYTHLSEKVTKISIETLKNHLTESGILAITIRPLEYWNYKFKNNNSSMSEDEILRLKEDHNNNGFAFYPHNKTPIEGEVTYGDTSMTLDYINKNFSGLEVIGVEYNEGDSLQLIVFLKKAK